MAETMDTGKGAGMITKIVATYDEQTNTISVDGGSPRRPVTTGDYAFSPGQVRKTKVIHD